MKKLLIIISLLFTLVITGVLHGKHVQRDVIGTVSIDQTNSNQFPVQMPDLVLNPVIIGFILY
jgi:hypothetical protein